jgi:transcriptional regulator with XRE-family HTH domain
MIWDGDKIKNLRRKMGWSAEDLARRLNCLKIDIMNWENEKTLPPRFILDRLTDLEQMGLENSSALADSARIESMVREKGLEQASMLDLEHADSMPPEKTLM